MENTAKLNMTPKLVQMTERRDLVRRAQLGDPEAFARIYAAHRRRVYSLCVRMVHNREDAEDLMQEAFLQVFRKLHTFRGDSAFTTWLYRVTVNVVLMKLRRKPWRETPLEEIGRPDDEESARPEFGAADERLDHSLDRIALERALDELPPGYRMVFSLHDVLGYEHQEAAEIMGCSAGNCKSQLHKARMKLRSVLRARREVDMGREAA
jgi:RNA polymerase sigma-70 factor (ECF subfamily)